MKRLVLFALTVFWIAASGCAYYNTLYHAKQYY